MYADRAHSSPFSQPALDIQIRGEVFAQGTYRWIVVDQRDVYFTTHPVTEISSHRDRCNRIKAKPRERLLVTDLIRWQLEKLGKIFAQPPRYNVRVGLS